MKLYSSLISGENSNIFTELINITLIIYAALLPFSSAFTIFTGPYILLFLWILEGNWKVKIEKIKKFKPLIFLSIFIIWNLLSFIWSNNIHEAYRSLKFYLAIFLPFLILFTSLKKDRKYIFYITNSFLFSMFISEILMYGNFANIWMIGRGDQFNASPIIIRSLYSIFIVSTIFVLLFQILSKSADYKIKLIDSLFLIISIISLFINSGRAGQVVFIFAILIFIFTYFGFNIKNFIGAILLITFIFSSAYNLSPIFNKRVEQAIKDIKKIKQGDMISSWGGRVAAKIISIKIIKDNFLIGVGIGDVLSEFRNRIKKKYYHKFKVLLNFDHLHDQHLQIILESGLIGIIILLLFFISFFLEDYNNLLAKSTLFTIVSIFFLGCFTDAILRNYPSALFGFLLGILSYAAKKDEVLNEQ